MKKLPSNYRRILIHDWFCFFFQSAPYNFRKKALWSTLLKSDARRNMQKWRNWLACSVAQRASATATELQSMGCRLDAGRGQEPIDDLRSTESCLLPLGKVITLWETFMRGANYHSERSRGGQIWSARMKSAMIRVSEDGCFWNKIQAHRSICFLIS